MKHEWRKQEKELYTTKTKPQIVTIPPLKYFTIEGEGNPNGSEFQKCIEVLYAHSYAIRMSHKKGIEPEGYYEYTVYPLEGFYSLNEKGIEEYQKTQKINKDNLTFKIMIRQPDFVDSDYAKSIMEQVNKDKPHDFNNKLKFEEIEEGLSLQILHKGPFEIESESFKIMDDYCLEHGLKRMSQDHKEIYLTDTRKSKPENYKTILRIPVFKV